MGDTASITLLSALLVCGDTAEESVSSTSPSEPAKKSAAPRSPAKPAEKKKIDAPAKVSKGIASFFGKK